ncbi:SDR family NAD(P)-dependent oxidoreductase [Actinomadura keratinilytica]
MRHVLVTGAASGIGRAIAARFAAQGATLTLADRERAPLDDLAAHLPTATGVLTADLTAPDTPADLVRRAWADQGPVDVLVNAAGVYPSLDMAELTAQAWDRLFAVNLRAPVLATAAYARLAAERGEGGTVVNISSGSALRARPGGGPYASSKAALEMATRAAALELGAHGIRVNAVSPGFVPVDSACNPVSEEYAAAIGANPSASRAPPRTSPARSAGSPPRGRLDHRRDPARRRRLQHRRPPPAPYLAPATPAPADATKGHPA